MAKKAQLYTHDGKSLTVEQWAEKTKISCSTIHKRLRAGYSIGQALTTGTLPLKRVRRPVAPEPTAPEAQLAAIRALLKVPMNDGDKLVAIEMVLNDGQ